MAKAKHRGSRKRRKSRRKALVTAPRGSLRLEEVLQKTRVQTMVQELDTGNNQRESSSKEHKAERERESSSQP